GPFRGWTHTELQRASVKEALQHPVWSMGPKITIDSATLMNKGLEVIEAHYLFDLDYSQIHVLIHPEGIVHGMAEFRDGSLRAEMATADMRLPIQLALAWPERLPTGVEPVPLTERQLTFEPVDREAFPAVDLAYRVGGLGLTFPAVMNAANEVAVMAFLEGKIPLTRIVDAVQTVVDEHEPASIVSVVIIHEGGHYLGARLYNFRILEYFIGFGPRLWSFRRGEIEYGVKAIPAGGYVKIAGMNPFENDVPEGDEPRAYGAKPIHQRIVVILAGPLSHFLVAWLIFAAVFMFSANWNVPGIVGVTQTMDGKPSPASVAGIQ